MQSLQVIRRNGSDGTYLKDAEVSYARVHGEPRPQVEDEGLRPGAPGSDSDRDEHTPWMFDARWYAN